MQHQIISLRNKTFQLHLNIKSIFLQINLCQESLFSMEKILNVLEKNGVLNQSTLTANHEFLYDQRPGDDVYQSSSDVYQITCPSSVSQELFEKTKSQIDTLQENIQMSKTLSKGQKMSTYHDLHQLHSESISTLQHQQNQVLLVDVWATWCGPCQKPMQHNQQMLTKNENKWKNQVRIVAVSVDESKEQILERINSKGWNKIQHLTLLGWKNQHQLIQDFQISGIPFVFLVNKSGIIDFVGHPMEINLEERINQLLEEEVNQDLGQKKPEKANLSIEQIITEVKKSEGLNQLLSKEKLQEKFGKLDLFSLKGSRKISIVKGKCEFEPFELKLSVYEDSTEAIQQLKDYLKEIDPKIYKLEENVVKFVVPPTAQNAECADCKGKLQYPFYWCKWDPNPNTLRCRECVEKKPAQQGKHYSYLQNSILLAGPFKKIALKGCGSNIQPEKVEDVTQPHYFGCNGCGLGPQEVGQARYICLGCRSDPNYRGDYVDICENCFKQYFNGDNQLREKLQQSESHKANHPLLRVLYNVDNYYNY